MIPKAIFQHILRTISELPSRPIVFFSGDEAQQQPIQTVKKRTVQTNNIMQDPNFLQSVMHYKLNEQFRCTEPRLQSFLNHIRNWEPDNALLESIQKNILSRKEPSNDVVLNGLASNPSATVVTVTRKACNRINTLMID